MYLFALSLVISCLQIGARFYLFSLSLSVVNASVFMFMLYCFCYCAFVVCFKTISCDGMSLVIFFLKIALSIEVVCVSLNELQYYISQICEDYIDIVRGTALNLQTILGSMNLLALLTISLHEYGTFLHLWEISIAFCSVLKFSLHSSYTSLAKFIPRYLKYYYYLYGCGYYEYNFRISFSANSLTIYRKAIHFCIKHLYSVTLWDSFIGSHSLLEEFLGFSIQNNITYKNG